MDYNGEIILDDIALENIPAQKALINFGFEHDPSYQEIFMVKMTKKMLLNKYSHILFET